jgi:hypothetical protein
VVETLLERGADPNLPSAADLPLTIAARQSDKALVELLLSKGARINAVDGNGRTALLWMASGSNLDTNGLETVSLLHDRGADPNLADQSGRTPLHHSVARGSTNLLALLVQRGADVSARDKQGRTLLHEAVDSNRSEIVAAVLALKVDPNLPNKSGITPLDDAKRARPAGRRSQPVVTEEQSAIAAMLRQHGALDELPQWDRIMVRRVSVSFLTPVLWKGTNDWNRFNLIELIAAHYNLVSAWPIWSVNYQWTYGFGQPSSSRQYGDKSYKTRLTSTETSVGIPFPDLSRIVIRRPTADGRKWETIPVNLTEILASGECDKAPWLEWGDVVELPESDHLVDEVWSSFGSEIMGQLKKCLKRDILLLIKGETNSLTLEPKVTADQTRKLVLTWTANQPYSLVPVLTTSGLLRASSDVSKVKVTRVDPGGAKKEWVLDCSDPKNAPDLWLRDGDVIEVPEKP